jgi:trimeric autotransporter adhesin
MKMARSTVIMPAILIILFAITSPGWAITEQSFAPWCTFIGSGAGASSSLNGEYNAYFGYNAGNDNVYGDYNVFLGYKAGVVNASGNGNTFAGYEAGYMNTSGSFNICIGHFAGYANETNHFNTYIGALTGLNNKGSRNVFIGLFAGYTETSGSDLLYVANSGTSTPLIYGDFDTYLLKINGSLVFASDERLKEDIEPLKSSLDKVMRLKPVSYESAEDDGTASSIGLIAQDVETVIPELVLTYGKGYKALSYDRLAPVLVEAIKEQQTMINEQKDALASKSLLIDSQGKELERRRAVTRDLAEQLAALRAEVGALKGKSSTMQK